MTWDGLKLAAWRAEMLKTKTAYCHRCESLQVIRELRVNRAHAMTMGPVRPPGHVMKAGLACGHGTFVVVTEEVAA